MNEPYICNIYLIGIVFCLEGTREGGQEKEGRKEFQRILKKSMNNTKPKLSRKHFEVLPYQPMHEEAMLLVLKNKTSREQLRQPHAEVKGSPGTSAASGRVSVLPGCAQGCKAAFAMLTA